LPSPPPGPVPDLRGTWTGTWGGRPASLLVTDQRDEFTDSGVFLGSYALLAERRPGLTGILTSSIGQDAISTNAQGWFGYSGGRLMLVVRADTADGSQYLTLGLADERRLRGTGESSFRWGPRGPVELTRQPSPPKP
jgi:hypothetical protein